MQTISSWHDLAHHGIELLTGEACGLSYRLLCDVTEKGRRVLARCFGVPAFAVAEPWNRGTPEEPHIGSVLLTPDMLVPLGVFALLEVGCTEVWLYKNGALLGVEPGDPANRVELAHGVAHEAIVRVLRPAGTAGDRNRHAFTGRVQ